MHFVSYWTYKSYIVDEGGFVEDVKKKDRLIFTV